MIFLRVFEAACMLYYHIFAFVRHRSVKRSFRAVHIQFVVLFICINQDLLYVALSLFCDFLS